MSLLEEEEKKKKKKQDNNNFQASWEQTSKQTKRDTNQPKAFQVTSPKL